MLSVSYAGKNAYSAGKTSGASAANRGYVLAHCAPPEESATYCQESQEVPTEDSSWLRLFVDIRSRVVQVSCRNSHQSSTHMWKIYETPPMDKKVKISLLAPFTSKSADFYEIIRPKGAEKQAVSLRNRLEK